MKTKYQIRCGDTVEVELVSSINPLVPAVRMAGDAPPSLYPVRQWLPATVVHVDQTQIAVAFSDGERLAIPRYSHHWRPA